MSKINFVRDGGRIVLRFFCIVGSVVIRDVTETKPA